MRGKLKNFLDRATGWFVVSIVGFLAAIVAFMIVRSEQWLFDLKEGYCTEGIFKAKRFCCPLSVDLNGPTEDCGAWKTWSELLDPVATRPGSPISFASWMIEYISYTIVAVCP